ncbi:MAG: stalk domain-containing protein [Mobilitalea sp.]
MKKTSLLLIMVMVMTLISSSAAFAGVASSIKVTENNQAVKFSEKSYIKNGEVMIPLKQTALALGATVEWDKKSNTEWVDLGMMHIELTVGKSEFYIHRDADFSGIPQIVKLSTPIEVVKGRIFVPGKTFVENIGMTASWDSNKRVLAITNSNATDVDLSKAVPYTEITTDDISNIKEVNEWYNLNNQKAGISYLKQDGVTYVLIGAGEKPTGGFSVSIDKIFYSAADTVTINAKVTPPGDNVRVMMVITYPSMLIAIKSDSIKVVNGEVVNSTITVPTKEKWITMDASTVTKMELFTLDQVKLKDIIGIEKDDIMKSFNEATINPNAYVKMIAGNTLKVTTNDGYVLTFTSYGSDMNVIVAFEKDGESRSFHIVAPVIAKTLLKV